MTTILTETVTVRPHYGYMQVALSLAQRGLGNVWPNPAVGCIIVNNDRIVGRGWTQPGGRPHAEREALDRAGELALGATAYITLEPCSHQGQTPPCAEALIEAGIKQVFVGFTDPDDRTSGKGIETLRTAGIDVETEFLSNEAANSNKGFFTRVEKGRPYFTLKTATTADGKIATKRNDSRWITGDEARRFGHFLRATHDAVMIGSGTALTDDPDLTCRLPGLSNQRRPRIIIDGRLRFSPYSNLARSTDQAPVWLITLKSASTEKISFCESLGVTIIKVEADKQGHPDIKDWSQELGRRGLTRILVEGGSKLAGSLFASNMIDSIAWFRAPMVIGNDGIPAVPALGNQKITDLQQFRPTLSRIFGQDRLDIFDITR